MQQYVIIASDGTDDDALTRRLAVRANHFEGAAQLKENGNFILGGAILNDAGKMSGSVMVMQFETEMQLKEWLNKEPYITGNVWQHIEVKPFKVAEV